MQAEAREGGDGSGLEREKWSEKEGENASALMEFMGGKKREREKVFHATTAVTVCVCGR